MTLPTITATFATPLEAKAASAPAVSGIASPEQWLLDWGSLPTVPGPVVNPVSAMGVPAVKAAVELISGAIGSLPVKVFRQDADGTPIELFRLQPEAVSILYNPLTGEPVFKLNTVDGDETISHADMIHVPAPASLDGITGTAPIVRARNVISLALAPEQHASRIFAKGRPSGILTTPAVRSADGAKNLQSSFGFQHANENSGGLAVADMTFTATEFKSVDQQFAEMRAFQIHEIAKVFNVPPTLIGELAKATLSNSEQMGRQFLQMTLLPWINLIKAAYRRTLISREGRKSVVVDFDTSALLEPDAPARAAFYSAMRTAGVMTDNEVRARLNLPARPDGNSLSSPHTASAAPTPEPIVV